jgi:cytoskeletal protein CcmA (bactofilin family)
MFTMRPSKNGGNGQKNGSGNGHKNGNGNGNGHGGHIESVLGPGIHFKGTLTGTGGARIEGSFDGTINLGGPLVVADGAKVTAEIQASAVSVGGSVKGNVTAGKVEILSTGRVWGDLVTSAFATEEGSFLRGQITMQDEHGAEAPVEDTQPSTVTA